MAQTLGSRIRDAREAAGLTQMQLATKAKIGEGTLRKYETGRARNPGVGQLRKLARVLGVPVASLLDSGSSSSAVAS